MVNSRSQRWCCFAGNSPDERRLVITEDDNSHEGPLEPLWVYAAEEP